MTTSPVYRMSRVRSPWVLKRCNVLSRFDARAPIAVSSAESGEALDEGDELFPAVAVAASVLDELSGARHDGTALRRRGDSDAATATELE